MVSFLNIFDLSSLFFCLMHTFSRVRTPFIIHYISISISIKKDKIIRLLSAHLLMINLLLLIEFLSFSVVTTVSSKKSIYHKHGQG